MKVVQINSECGRGSTGKIAVSISRCLNECQIENRIFYSANHKSDYEQGVMIGSKMSLRFHQLLSRIFGNQGFHSYFSTKKLIRLIKDYEPDVILLHNLHGYYLHIGVLFRFLKDYNKPVLWTLHDCWSFTGHCAHYMNAGCDRWLIGCGKCPQKSGYPYSWCFDRSRRLYQKKRDLFLQLRDLTLITPSNWLANEVKKSFLRDKECRVIHNGINIDLFRPLESNFKEKHGIADKIMVLGVASVWSTEKGLDTFIELNTKLDAKRYAIVLVGTDARLDSILPGSIISVHRTRDQRELAEIYSAADIFVNPTRQDTYPTVNMEAQACGTPVVTFNNGGCSETLTEHFGTLVESEDYESLQYIVCSVKRKSLQSCEDCSIEAQRFDERGCFVKYVDLCIEVHSRSGAF